MKKILLSCALTIILPYTFGAVVPIVSCNEINGSSGCDSCFKEEDPLYTCNSSNQNCNNKEGITLMSDIVTNTAVTGNKVMYDNDEGQIYTYPLQGVTWSKSATQLLDMFQFPAAYIQGRENFTVGPTMAWSDVSNAYIGYKLTPGSSVKWIEFKPNQWIRPDYVGNNTSRSLPSLRAEFIPRLYTNATTYVDHKQCVFYYVRFCGDGITDPDKGEQCDDGNMVNGDTCSNTCQNTSPGAVCTNLAVNSPANATVTGGGTVSLTCTGSGTITSYTIVVKKPDGSVLKTITTATGTATIPATPTGTYTATCFVNNQSVTTLPACEKSINNNEPIPDPLCSYLEGVPSTLETNQSFTYTCHADRAKSGTEFTISGISPIKTGTSNTGYYTNTHAFTTAGSYTVSCKVNNGTQVSDCQKTVTVSVPKVPNITIDKRDANQSDSDGIVGNDIQTVSSGAKAVFKIKVTNNGTEDLKNISLSDTIAPNCAGNVTLSSTPTKPSTWSNFTFGGSGSHTDTLFQPGEWFEYTCEKDNTLTDYTNTARVDAIGNTSGIGVYDTDPTDIILEPLCTNLSVTPDTTTTNTLVSYNCTARGALSYQITKDGSYASNSASGTMSFATPGEYELKCFINNKTTTPTSCVKKITVTNPPIITNPSIFIDKDDSTPGMADSDGNDIQKVQNNGTATFTIRVLNNGNEALKTVVISDTLADDCARTSSQTASLYSGGASTNFDIDESFTYTCTKKNVVTSTFPNNKNTASVKGVGVTSSTNVTDSDVTEIFMKQNNPNITIVKDDDDNNDDTQEIDENEAANFSIRVTNNGDESLENVRIYDELASSCEKDESETRDLIRGIGNRDSLFDPDESFKFTCREKNISPDTFPDEVNTACTVATGVDSKKGVDECDDTEIIINEVIDEPLMCYAIESSEGTFGGAPFRTIISCDVEAGSSCIIEVTKDGEVLYEYDSCTKSITFDDTGDYSVACIVDDERSPDCEMSIEVAAMTDVPTGAKILIIAFLSLMCSAIVLQYYKEKTF